jgi:phosphoribosylanthranilate isomerase
MASTHIKVCCIGTAAEARAAVAAGAYAVGLVSAMPSGPGVIDEAAIAAIARAVPPPVATFLLTSRQDAEAIAEQHQRCLTSTLQLCDRILPGQYGELRRLLPGVRLVQVVHVSGPSSVDEALAAAGSVDALLLDSGNQRLAVKELGGTGRTHDWVMSRKVVEASPVPVFLAGGLTPANVRAAIDAVGPFGVDVCSGLRTDGALDQR